MTPDRPGIWQVRYDGFPPRHVTYFVGERLSAKGRELLIIGQERDSSPTAFAPSPVSQFTELLGVTGGTWTGRAGDLPPEWAAPLPAVEI